MSRVKSPPHYRRIYKTLNHMKDRCYNQKCKDYHMWGGRGITICDEWLRDVKSFYDWAMTHGYKDNLTIDRIDNNKGYSPDNCRWVDRKTQARNTRRNRLITINGETKCLVEWCEVFNINYDMVKRRLHRGWSTERAFNIILENNEN